MLTAGVHRKADDVLDRIQLDLLRGLSECRQTFVLALRRLVDRASASIVDDLQAVLMRELAPMVSGLANVVLRIFFSHSRGVGRVPESEGASAGRLYGVHATLLPTAYGSELWDWQRGRDGGVQLELAEVRRVFLEKVVGPYMQAVKGVALEVLENHVASAYRACQDAFDCTVMEIERALDELHVDSG